MKYLKISPSTLRHLTDYSRVNCIRTSRDALSFQFIAHFTSGARLEITQKQHMSTFPNEPLKLLSKDLEANYLDNFIVINESRIAINKENFSEFTYTPYKDERFVDINANFKNGECVRLYGVKAKNLKAENAQLEKILSKEIEEMEI